jgi:hypothetical protein
LKIAFVDKRQHLFCYHSRFSPTNIFGRTNWMKESDSNILLPGSTASHITVTPEGTLRIGQFLKNLSNHF